MSIDSLASASVFSERTCETTIETLYSVLPPIYTSLFTSKDVTDLLQSATQMPSCTILGAVDAKDRLLVEILASKTRDGALRVIVKSPPTAEDHLTGSKGQWKSVSLGEGVSKKIYKAISFIINPDGTFKSPPSLIALAKIKATHYDPLTTALVHRAQKEIPSPHLLAIPDGIFPHTRRNPTKERQYYLSMPLLEKPTLYDLLEGGPSRRSDKERWKIWTIGIANAAKGCLSLLEKGILHRDPTTMNITPDGIFDFDSICTLDEPHVRKGAALKFLPPEILIQRLHAAGLARDKDLIKNIMTILKTRGYSPEEVVTWLREFSTVYEVENPKLPALYYSDKSDVFILGAQCEVHFGAPETWPTDESTKGFILTMTSPYEAARPSMAEVSCFFEKLSSSIYTEPS